MDKKEKEVNELLQKINLLKRELRIKDEVLHRKNLELDSLHMVWCSGSCEDGIHRFTDGTITKEMIEFVHKYATRLATKYVNLLSKNEWMNNTEKARRISIIFAKLHSNDELLNKVEKIIEDNNDYTT